jgi:hypothetical protein
MIFVKDVSEAYEIGTQQSGESILLPKWVGLYLLCRPKRWNNSVYRMHINKFTLPKPHRLGRG